MAQTNRLKRTLLLVGALLVIIAVHTLTSSMFADMKENNAAQAEQAELYENIVGEKFEKAEDADILARIEKNVTDCLASL